MLDNVGYGGIAIMKTVTYAWNEDVKNYCLACRSKHGKPVFYEPLQEIDMSELDDEFRLEVEMFRQMKS